MIGLIIFAVVLLVLYLYSTRTFGYWAKRGVKHETPVPLFGSYVKDFLVRQSRSESLEEIYWKFPNEKVVGYFRSSTPELVLRDPELIKKVLISDFSHFYMRGIFQLPDKLERVIRNVFFIDEGDLWKMLRQRITPAFTTNKLKGMFPLIIERAEKLRSRTLNAAKKGKPIDARDLMARYTTDFIGCCGFGLDADSLNDENSEFRRLGYDAFNLGLKDYFIMAIKEIFPKMTQNWKVYSKIEDRAFNLVNSVQESKGYKSTNRGDFIDHLLEIKNKGPVEIESIEKFLPDGTPEKVTIEFSNDLVVAQTFLFFAAGFETSSSTTSTSLHYLAFNPEIQKKVHKEIDEVLARYDNKLSYDAVKEMTYLECVFKEGMRMFPALGHLLRVCTQKYTFEDINLTIDPGVKIAVPVKALHMDPKYWDNPTEFRPERFLPNEFTPKQKAAYFAFGEGPRNCIGARLGLMQSMAGLAAVLSHFSVEPAPESVKFPGVDPFSDIVQSPKGGSLPLIFKERRNTVTST